MLKIIYWNSFKKDLKLAQKRGHAIEKFTAVVNLLVKEEPLPPKMRDHKLKGDLKNYRECHIEPDWLLIYQKTAASIIFARTGTHADLF